MITQRQEKENKIKLSKNVNHPKIPAKTIKVEPKYFSYDSKT